MSDEDAAERRRAAAEQADYHAQTQRRREQQESAEAQVLIDAFVATAKDKGLATEPLMARPWSGRGRYRTGVEGWYLRQDESIGLDTDGRFYVLTVAPQGFGRRTVTIEPSPPPLDPGRGARDGESADLAALLAIRLAR